MGIQTRNREACPSGATVKKKKNCSYQLLIGHRLMTRVSSSHGILSDNINFQIKLEWRVEQTLTLCTQYLGGHIGPNICHINY